MTHIPDGAQERLLFTTPDGGFFIPELEEVKDPQVAIVERNIHLLRILAIFDDLHGRNESFQKAMHTDAGRQKIVEHYGSEQAALRVMSGMQRHWRLAMKEAKWSFARAAGMFEMIDNGGDVDTIRFRMNRFFVRFRHRYDGPQKAIERSHFQDQLLKGIRQQQDAVTHHNRDNGLRPHRKDAKPTPETDSTDQPLATRERLWVLHDDIRAGFFPATHREKNRVLDSLDYLDNPKYPLGTNNQQLEIFNHQARLQETGKKLDGGPERAAESLAWESVDYLNDAVESLKRLRYLRDLIAQHPDDFLNPNLIPAHVFNDGSDDYHEMTKALALVRRFMDAAEYASGGDETAFKDPMRTCEDRWTRTGPGRHKIVHDQYVKPTSQKAGERLFGALTELDVYAIRTLLPAAIIDQMKRAMFHAEAVQAFFRLEQGPFKPARDLAIAALSSIDIEYITNAAA